MKYESASIFFVFLKAFVLTCIIMLTGFAMMQAQQTRFGIKAGGNLADITGDTSFPGLNEKMRTAFHIGGVAEIPLGKRFFLEPELLYSAQGTKWNGTLTEQGNTFSADAVMRLGYLTLPVLVRYVVADNFSLEAGPQLGLLLSAKIKATFSGGGEPSSGTEDIKDTISDFDFGLNFGAGYRLNSALFLQGRFHLGLMNINNDFDEKNQNMVLQLSVGYMF